MSERLAGVRVLVVDDEPLVRQVVTILLQDYGAVVTSVGSAADALRVLPVERPDVLLTDLTMPEADGFSLIRRVRALPTADGGGTPAVLVTGQASVLDSTEVLRAGFQLCLAKPVNAREVVESVAVLATQN
jgi:CheY-like chemotaxis protein